MKKLVLVMTAFTAAAFMRAWADTTLTVPYEGTSLATAGHIYYVETNAEKGVISAPDSARLTWTHDNQGGWPYFRMYGDYTNPAELILRRVDLTNRSMKLVVAAGGWSEGENLGGHGHLVLDQSILTLEKCYLAHGKILGSGQSTQMPVASLELKNGSVLDATWLYMSEGSADADHMGGVTNRLTLGADSEVRVGGDDYGRTLARFNDASCQVVFDGGRVYRKSGLGQVFTPGGWASSNSDLLRYSVVNTPGNDLIVSTGGTNVHFYGRYMASNPTREFFDLDLTSAICKQGWGLLRLDLPDGETASNYSLKFDGLKVECGVLAQAWDLSAFPVQPVSVSTNAALDLAKGTLKARFVDFEGGAGTVTARGASGSLTVGSDEDEMTDVEFAGKLSLVKDGTGTFSAKTLGLDAAGLAVRGGTLKLSQRDATPGVGYRKYRFRVTDILANEPEKGIMEIGELAVFSGENDVTKSAQVFADWTTLSTHGDADKVGKTFSFYNNKWESPENVVDGNLSTKVCDLRKRSNAAWWIGLDFGEPTVLTGYKWADAGETARKPKSWVFEGSDDGVCWTELGSVSNYEGQSGTRTWVGGGEIFPVAETLHTVERLGAVSVAHDATLDLSEVVSSVEMRPAGDFVGTVKLPEGGCLTLVCDSDLTVQADVFSATASTLVKAGPGRLTIAGRLSTGIKTEVREGVLSFAPTAFAGKYFRFTVKDIRDVNKTGENNGKVMNLGKLYLYDATGAVVNANLAWRGGNPTGNNWKNESDGTLAKDLAEGTFSQAGQYKYSIWNGAHEAPYWIFYPESDTHKWTTTDHVFYPVDSSTWYTINFRIWDASAPVVSYNLRSVGNQVREVSAWSLEGSFDGETWYLLDEKSIGSGAPTSANTWYNGGVAYVADLSQVPADDLTLAGLSVDCAPDAVHGTLAKFNPAENGTLTLVNVSAEALKGGLIEVPLAVSAFAPGAAAKLKTWTVSADGVALEGWTVAVRDGRLVLRKRMGLIILIQ